MQMIFTDQKFSLLLWGLFLGKKSMGERKKQCRKGARQNRRYRARAQHRRGVPIAEQLTPHSFSHSKEELAAHKLRLAHVFQKSLCQTVMSSIFIFFKTLCIHRCQCKLQRYQYNRLQEKSSTLDLTFGGCSVRAKNDRTINQNMTLLVHSTFSYRYLLCYINKNLLHK